MLKSILLFVESCSSIICFFLGVMVMLIVNHYINKDKNQQLNKLDEQIKALNEKNEALVKLIGAQDERVKVLKARLAVNKLTRSVQERRINDVKDENKGLKNKLENTEGKEKEKEKEEKGE